MTVCPNSTGVGTARTWRQCGKTWQRRPRPRACASARSTAPRTRRSVRALRSRATPPSSCTCATRPTCLSSRHQPHRNRNTDASCSLKDNQLYAYKGARKVDDFLKFAESGYKAVDPVPVPAPAVVVEEVRGGHSSSGLGWAEIRRFLRAHTLINKNCRARRPKTSRARPLVEWARCRSSPPRTSPSPPTVASGSSSSTPRGADTARFVRRFLSFQPSLFVVAFAVDTPPSLRVSCVVCRVSSSLSFFFSPQSLAPTWEKTASELKGKVNIAKVDCTTDGFVCQLFGVRGYPTLKLYVAPSSLICRF